MQKTYNVHDLFEINVHGTGKSAQNLNLQLNGFESKRKSKENEIFKIDVNIDKVNDGNITIGSVNKNAYQRNDNAFIIVNKGHKIELNAGESLSEQKKVTIEPKLSPDLSIFILESILRLNVIKKGVVLSHSAAASHNEQGLLLLAWQGTGKTTSCLSLVNEGFEFLGDDRVWINSKGEILAYPRYVRINKSNIHVFYKHLNKKSQIQYKTYKKLKKIIKTLKLDKKSKVISKIINSGYLLPKTAKPIQQLIVNAKISKTAKLKNIVYLEKSNEGENFEIKNISTKSTSEKMELINCYEWNNVLISHAIAHDLLFPDGVSWVNEIEKFKLEEKKLMSIITSNVKSYSINVPTQQTLLPKEIVTRIKNNVWLRGNSY